MGRYFNADDSLSTFDLNTRLNRMCTKLTIPAAFITFALISATVLFISVHPMVQNALAHDSANTTDADAASTGLRFVRLNVENSPHRLERAKIVGGWIVTGARKGAPDSGFGIAFVPDPEHLWDGGGSR